MTSVIAHRGASAYVPENAFTAFNLAFEMSADDITLNAPDALRRAIEL